VVTIAAGRYVLNVAATASPLVVQPAIVNQDLGKSSNNNVLAKQTFTDDTTWCVSVTNAKGDKAVTGYKYSASGGLNEGVCVAADVA